MLVYGLQNVGFMNHIIYLLQRYAVQDAMYATLAFGFLTTILSNTINNLPAVVFDIFSILEMNLELLLLLLQITFLTNVFNSDSGSLLTLIGTQAPLSWIFILKKEGVYMICSTMYVSRIILFRSA